MIQFRLSSFPKSSVVSYVQPDRPSWTSSDSFSISGGRVVNWLQPVRLKAFCFAREAEIDQVGRLPNLCWQHRQPLGVAEVEVKTAISTIAFDVAVIVWFIKNSCSFLDCINGSLIFRILDDCVELILSDGTSW
jgi:hypothetical protein